MAQLLTNNFQQIHDTSQHNKATINVDGKSSK